MTLHSKENPTSQKLDTIMPAEYIGALARQALIAEVDTTPKPGLVDRADSGAHRDMDRNTFLASADAIAPYLTQMAEAGYGWDGDLPKLFSYIRPMGMRAEESMFRATSGVNTHKGLIFTLGILCACEGYLQAQGQGWDAKKLLAAAGDMTADTLEQEFELLRQREPRTHGERLFFLHGVRGIRGEAALGFPSLRDCALPALRDAEKLTEDRNLMFLQTLLHLMAQVEDTNVLFRTDFETALGVRKAAEEILKLGGCLTPEGLRAVQELNQTFIEGNISPGGCADLLAAAIFLWLLEKGPSAGSATQKEGQTNAEST